jgi:guanosine-3',5'-bis(diphosphate) 3'-pyrophosphohydrolase
VLQIEQLCDKTASYLRPRQVAEVRRAYAYSAKAHSGQLRKSGEPYVQHPLEVADILADMHMDYETLVAAMLHDVLEDTPTAKDQISAEFGTEVAEMVDGVSKLDKLRSDNLEETQADNLRKMLMAMSHDIRVILVKLADRLHNMRTLGALPPEKRRRIARETLSIYAPIAQRLGMHSVKLELEELGFRHLYPMRHRVLSARVMQARGNRKEILNKIRNALKRRLRQEKIKADVKGREKHVYSIYKKMKEKHLSFSEVHDVYGFRLVVDTVDTCYRVLGTVHNLYKPVPNKFKDYIAIPKANGYQSLHTVLFGPYGLPIEVQIRTSEMDAVAEAGVAAHWLYKSSDGRTSFAHQRAREWLRGVLEMQKQAGNSEEFLEHVKVDLFPDVVYVFTPKGEILELSRGATAVDLAYAIHTDIGRSCVAARVDRRLMPLSTPLRTGQTVEIITAPGAQPNPAWLNFVVTGKARAHIRHYLKNLKRDEAAHLGQRMLNRELERYSTNLDKLGEESLRKLLKKIKVKRLDDLLAEIGLGDRMAPLVARTLVTTPESDQDDQLNDRRPAPLMIKGTEGMVVSLPKCCHPIPGDPIIGYVSAGRGLVVHHRLCKNVAEFRKQPEKWLEVAWAPDVKGEFGAEIRLEVTNQRGALANIAATIAEEGGNIVMVEMADRDDRYVSFKFIVAVTDRQHLANVIRRVRNIKHVAHLHRVRG